MTAYKHSGFSVPTRVRDGVLYCWCCDKPMVQPDPERPDLWQCAWGAEQARQIREGLAAAFARLAEDAIHLKSVPSVPMRETP